MIQTTCTRFGKHSIANAPPVIGEGPFCTQKVYSEREVEYSRKAPDVCHHYWCNDLRGLEDLRRDIDDSSEDENPINMAACRVENEDAEDLEKENFCPRISSHC